MRRRLLVAGGLVALVVSVVAAVPAGADPGERVGSYIVVLKGVRTRPRRPGGTGPRSGTCTGMR
jgi:hypothetical protein